MWYSPKMSSPENNQTPESDRQNPRIAYLFDVDGVLTDPEAKKVNHSQIFNQLIKRLQRKEPVGLNTGRSLEFMTEHVLNHLEAMVSDKKLLRNIFAVGEKGAAWITYDDKGKRSTHVDKDISVPHKIQNEVREMVSQPQYADTMFYDETKLTMVSVELLPRENRPGKSFIDFQTAQKQLNTDLQNLIFKHHLDSSLKVDPTRIATDLENKHVGKALGVRKYIELLHCRGIEPDAYLSFGDSTSDYDMHEELLRLGKKSQFVFVGGREHLRGKSEEGVIFTDKHVDEGTLEFLEKEPTNS